MVEELKLSPSERRQIMAGLRELGVRRWGLRHRIYYTFLVLCFAWRLRKYRILNLERRDTRALAAGIREGGRVAEDYFGLMDAALVLFVGWSLGRTSHRLLSLAARILPWKVAAEFVGDREEVLRGMIAEGYSRWSIQLEAAKSFYWAVRFALRRSVAELLGCLTGPQ
jgi:hypothetical protein